jgi:DNA modification methylase
MSLLDSAFPAAYTTQQGAAFHLDALTGIRALPDNSLDLVMTSPPFALLREKAYGNQSQADYVAWLGEFGRELLPKLKPTGSLVIDIGGAYQQGVPVQSLYNFRVPIYFCDTLGYHLAEDFYWYNPAKLPSPIEWVNKRKIRAKDAVNPVWWFSKTAFPKADVRNVLTPYSDRMKKLISDPSAFYDPKKRPSGHDIGSKFGQDNGGAIPSNLLQIPNTESNSAYLAWCKRLSISSHPARFPAKLPEFFIKFLTNPGDVVLDIFAGSNTTGEVAGLLGRQWLAFDSDVQYVAASSFRFLPVSTGETVARSLYEQILSGVPTDMDTYATQLAINW